MVRPLVLFHGGVVLVATVCLVSISGFGLVDEPLLYGKFPDGFAWALATSAFQIEGGWNEDGKGESNWDKFLHEVVQAPGNATGDVACDSYHKWQDDIQMLADIGATHYRFSISWSRILPTGTGEINQAGIDYYSNLIDGLLEKGIQPMVTLFHWDLPQVLEDQGGWLSEKSVAWFEEYALACYRAFGDRVNLWITFNEPWVICVMGYGTAQNAPGLTGIGDYVYQCGHNVLKAHARAYRRYYSDFAADQGGEVGITLNVNTPIPATNSTENVEAADRDNQFNLGWFAHPVLINGNYPQVMIDLIAEKSSAQGFLQSRLPEFTEEEMEMISGTADFLGINHYFAYYVEDIVSDINDVSYFADHNTITYSDPTWYSPDGDGWFRPAPPTFRTLLNWIKNEYNNFPVYITENGTADFAGNLDDMQRIYYLKHYINQMLKAITLDGCNIRGYAAWSLMDNLEWGGGFRPKFGVFRVDFNDPDRPRTMKASGAFLKQVFAENGFSEDTSCPYY